MKLPKLARFLGLSLILAATAAPPVSAARSCSCDFCQRVPPHVPCNLEGRTTCGAFLAVALCPAD